jgi:hypothetical protein
MSNLNQLEQILTKEVSRKEFLQHVGVLILGVIGVSALMNRLSQLSGSRSEKSASLPQSNGYGARSYGR